jgi:hypothetical protein
MLSEGSLPYHTKSYVVVRHCAAAPPPDPREVEPVHGFTLVEMAAQSELLDSNREFLDPIARGEIRLDQ